MRRKYVSLKGRFLARLDAQVMALSQHPDVAAGAPASADRLEEALQDVRTAGLAQVNARNALLAATEREQQAIRAVRDLFARNVGHVVSVLGADHADLAQFGVAVRRARRAARAARAVEAKPEQGPTSDVAA